MRNQNTLIALAVIVTVVVLALAVWQGRRAVTRWRARAAAKAKRNEARTTPWEYYSRPNLGTDGRTWVVGVERVTKAGDVLNRVKLVELDRDDETTRIDWEGRAIREAQDYTASKVGMTD
jgi:hypothetical protein